MQKYKQDNTVKKASNDTQDATQDACNDASPNNTKNTILLAIIGPVVGAVLAAFVSPLMGPILNKFYTFLGIIDSIRAITIEDVNDAYGQGIEYEELRSASKINEAYLEGLRRGMAISGDSSPQDYSDDDKEWKDITDVLPIEDKHHWFTQYECFSAHGYPLIYLNDSSSIGYLTGYVWRLIKNDTYSHSIHSLNAKYEEIIGTLGHVIGSGDASATLTIFLDYGNGFEKHKDFDMTCDMEDQEISIIVIDVTRIKFELYQTSDGECSYALVSPKIRKP